MFEVNLLSSDDILSPIATPRSKHAPVVVDLLSSSPIQRTSEVRRNLRTHSVVEPRTPPRIEGPAFDLSSSPILGAPVLPYVTEKDEFVLSSSPGIQEHEVARAPVSASIPETGSVETETQEDVIVPSTLLPPRGTKRAFKSNTDVTPKPLNNAKKFKAKKTSSAPAAVKLVTDRRKACDGIRCSVQDVSGCWKDLMSKTFERLELQVSCESAQVLLELEGIAAIITVSGEFSDEWDEEQNIFVKSTTHTEFMTTQIVILQADQLDALGKMDFPSRNDFFSRVRDAIAVSSDPTFNIVYVVPEVHVQFRKMMAAYDRRLRQRVMDHSNGRSVSVEQPPQQHYFNDVQVRLQVDNEIRAVYPRTKQEAAEVIANWVIDMCFSRYRMKTDATLEGVGGNVKSKSTAPEITAEALGVIHGLPPRIASSIAGDMKSMGNIYASLGANHKQQMAHLRYYGKGDWNESLITFLTCDDPDQTIG